MDTRNQRAGQLNEYAEYDVCACIVLCARLALSSPIICRWQFVNAPLFWIQTKHPKRTTKKSINERRSNLQSAKISGGRYTVHDEPFHIKSKLYQLGTNEYVRKCIYKL